MSGITYGRFVIRPDPLQPSQYKIQHAKGGALSVNLAGAFSSFNEAKRQIDNYEATNKAAREKKPNVNAERSSGS